MAALLDTGILFAYFDRRDKSHTAARRIFESEDVLLVPTPVIAEVDHLLEKYVGWQARLQFYQTLAEGTLHLVDLDKEHYPRILEINKKYSNLELGFVDAAVMALAETLRIRRIATVDRRHFGVVRLSLELELIPSWIP